ncbi:protein lethal(2)essential for life [Nasonia vitripennis]|uniref:SHSP domain-containing protein n=1 Tax=Nasonia vitripennis TaxID=7425 RepID=A0A7M7G5L9_NASVI|nr:protein lethal(2)essential for life [Nasonia vitripennis]
MRSRMSIIPKLVSQMWEQMERPHRLFDQHFGLGLHPDAFFNSPSLFERRIPYAYMRPLTELMREAENGWSVIKDDKSKFHVALDVQQFKPEEINVKVVDNYIVVEGKHEEKQDDHGIISRHFVRKYMIPEQCDPEKAASTLSSDGVLTITAPRKPEAVESKKEKVLKIEKTGKPALENKAEEQPQIENKKMAQSQ